MKAILRTVIIAGLLGAVPCGLMRGAAAQSEPPQTKPAPQPPAAAKAGRDRWSIKTAADPDAKEIDAKPVHTTVEKLLALPRPIDMPLDGSNPFFQQHRARPAETTAWTVEADVVDCRLMPDGDYRVTVRGASGKTIVLEMPNPVPEFVDPQSKFADKIKTARGQFDTKLRPESAAKPVAGHARITGIGFFGRTYGGRKAEGNLIQLHPVLNIEWLEKPTADFTAPKEDPAKSSEKSTSVKSGSGKTGYPSGKPANKKH